VTRWWFIGGSVRPCSGADLRLNIHFFFFRVVPSSLIKHNILSCKNVLKRESGCFRVGFLFLRYRLKQNLGATDDHIYPLRATTCTVAPQTTCRQVLLEELGKSCRQYSCYRYNNNINNDMTLHLTSSHDRVIRRAANKGKGLSHQVIYRLRYSILWGMSNDPQTPPTNYDPTNAIYFFFVLTRLATTSFFNLHASVYLYVIRIKY